MAPDIVYDSSCFGSPTIREAPSILLRETTMDFMLLPLKRYADFKGRSRRKEYWMFFLLNFCVSIGFFILSVILGQVSQTLALVVTGIQFLYGLAVIIPGISCGIRRLHDQDKSGWFLLLAFIPLVGPFIVLFFMVQEGTRGSNQYGRDPKAGE